VEDIVRSIPENIKSEVRLRGVLDVSFDGSMRVYVEQGQL